MSQLGQKHSLDEGTCASYASEATTKTTNFYVGLDVHKDSIAIAYAAAASRE